ncbi:hypothetical protein C0J52_15046 [Blattella germanica]|nr:hypothetical protein C0J52_15046 [Blattella germanica]
MFSVPVMNAAKFYGSTAAIKVVENGNLSDDPDLSDDDSLFRPRETNGFSKRDDIIVSESDDDGNTSEMHRRRSKRIVVPETDSETEENFEVRPNQHDDDDDHIPLAERLAAMQQNSKQRRKPVIQWNEENLVKTADETKFTGDTTLPQEILHIDTPVEYFRYFFTNEVIQYIVGQTNLYSIQCRPNKSVGVSHSEIEQFIGTSLFMSIIQLPATRHYWNSYLGHPAVNEVMSCNRWEEIKRFIHFCDNSNSVPASSPNHDKLFKIRPLLDKLRERLLLVPKEEFLAVDEQIIPTKCRSSLKQYNPKKPHKWGFKAFVLSGVSGFSYDYEIFAGAQSNTIIPGAPDLGASSNVVVRLTQTVPRHVNHKIFFDNWFTSVPLEVYLHKEGISSLGTVRANRVPCCLMPKETEMKKSGRGSMKEKVATVDGVQLSVVSWFDNKVVNTLSTYVGCKPEGEKKRLFRKEKEHKMIPCPRSVMVYNDYMGVLIYWIPC